MTEEEREEMEADNTPHYFCGDCKHFGHNPKCQKRIDHKSVKFAKPWFKSYDGNQFSGVPCCEFEPAEWNKYGCSIWKGWNDYWERYVKFWLPYSNTDTLVWFTLFDDTSVRYGVKLMDFINGTMIEGNVLKAVQKEYYRRRARTKNNSLGYQLVHEEIDGVLIEPPRNLARRVVTT